MAKTKQLIKEDDIDTVAGQSLHPDTGNASHSDDPKSKFEYLAKMIGSVHAARDEKTWTDWYKSTVDLIGKEARDVPGEWASKNTSSVDAKSSDAGSSTGPKTKEAMPSLKEAMKEDLAKIFDLQEGLSDEFKAKAAVLFETAVVAMCQLREEEMRAQVEEEAAEAFEQAVVDLAESVEGYLEEIAQKWFEENEVAVESSLRYEMNQDFMNGLKNLFVEHFIDVPEDRVDVVDALAQKVEALENQLAETIEENVELRKVVEQASKEDIVEAACEGLTTVDAERLCTLAEAVDADDVEEFAKKLAIIRESNFSNKKNGKAPAKPSMISEQLEEVNEDQEKEKEYSSPEMKRFADAISRSIRR